MLNKMLDESPSYYSQGVFHPATTSRWSAHYNLWRLSLLSLLFALTHADSYNSLIARQVSMVIFFSFYKWEIGGLRMLSDLVQLKIVKWCQDLNLKHLTQCPVDLTQNHALDISNKGICITSFLILWTWNFSVSY